MKWLMSIVVVMTLVPAQQEPSTTQDQQLQNGQETQPLQLYPEKAQKLTQFAQVAQSIAAAGSEIMVATDVLRSEEIAEALRAAVMRGVPVYIITPAENVEDPASYLVSLALAGANIRLGPVDGSFMTIDRMSVVVGDLVSGVMTLPGYEAQSTILVPDEAYTNLYVDSFYQAFEVAPVLDPASLALLQAPQQGGGE